MENNEILAQLLKTNSNISDLAKEIGDTNRKVSSLEQKNNNSFLIKFTIGCLVIVIFLLFAIFGELSTIEGALQVLIKQG